MTTESDANNNEYRGERFLTVREYAVERGCGIDTVYKRIWAKKVESKRKDGKWYIRADTK